MVARPIPNDERRIRGLRPSYKKDKQSALRTSVGGAQAAIEFKIFELKQMPHTIFHVKASSAETAAVQADSTV